jgi:hypothetical protein
MGTHQPKAPAPDVQGARAPFASLPEPLQPRTSETDPGYAAFLLWCMMAAPSRSKRLLARAMGKSDGTIRYWSNKHKWSRRMALVADAEWKALGAYRQLMDLQVGTGEAAGLRVALDVVLQRAGLAAVRHAVLAQRQGQPAGPPAGDVGAQQAGVNPAGPVSSQQPAQGQPAPAAAVLSENELEQLDAAQHLRSLRDSILREHLAVKDVKRQIMLIDACLGLIARKVQSGELEVKLSDIPQLLKARALLTGLPTEQVAVQQHHQHEHTVVVESARMRDARAQGGTAVLAAMQDELRELNVIMGAMPRAVELVDVPATGGTDG